MFMGKESTEANFELLKFTEKSQDDMITKSRTFLQDIAQRRTVRDFSDRPIPMEVISNAIKAAGTAPSGANQQPWHFVMVTSPETKQKIRVAAEHEERAFYQEKATEEWLEALQPLGTDENKPFLETAPCLIAIFLKKFSVDEKGIKTKHYYPVESVGIATGILITALHLSGLVTLTHTPSPMKFLNEILVRPTSERPFLILVVGYPNKNAEVPKISKYKFDQITSFA